MAAVGGFVGHAAMLKANPNCTKANPKQIQTALNQRNLNQQLWADLWAMHVENARVSKAKEVCMYVCRCVCVCVCRFCMPLNTVSLRARSLSLEYGIGLNPKP